MAKFIHFIEAIFKCGTSVCAQSVLNLVKIIIILQVSEEDSATVF